MEKKTRRPTAAGPKENFTGDVYVDGIADGTDGSRLIAAHVRFTPGARTNWHSHGLGQTLYCTDGVGFVATRDGKVIVLRAGETVWTPPGEEHWHGGTRDNLMCHVAMLAVPAEGDSTTWLDPVTEEQYDAAHTSLTNEES